MKCIICGSNKWKTKYKKLTQCSKCGYIRASNKYFLQSKSLYKKDYFMGKEYQNYKDEEVALSKNFQDRIKKIKKYKKHGYLLEIGSAFGFFLNEAKKYFKVEGIDVDLDVVKISRKITKSRIKQGDFLYTKYDNNSFDVVCMLDTIEHLREPQKFIQKANRILKKGGVLVIETGDIDTLLPKIQKEKWRLITPPYHLQYFSRRTLAKLLEKNGFEVLYKTVNISFYRTINQTLHRLKMDKVLQNLFAPFKNIIFKTYTFDLMFVIAKKK